MYASPQPAPHRSQPFSPQPTSQGTQPQPHSSGTGIEQFSRPPVSMPQARAGQGFGSKPSFRNTFDIDVDQTVDTEENDGAPPSPLPRTGPSRIGRNKSAR